MTAPIMILVYLLFDCIRCQFTGAFVYSFVDPKELTPTYALLAGIVVYVFVALLGLILFTLNRLVSSETTGMIRRKRSG